MGLRRNSPARRAAAEFIAEAGARFTFIAVGSPQQEMIAAEVRAIAGATGTALCIGAGLDFLTGRQKRAPRFAQHLGLEWAHRLLGNPRRMWRRYLLEGPRVFLLAYRWAGPPQHSPVSK
jgi:exopolysaccharide biosynthesis WecB/TagA/CpsF family protein